MAKTSRKPNASRRKPKTKVVHFGPGFEAVERPAEPSSPLLRQTKSATLVSLLLGSAGATVAQIARTTGWQAHTVRAAITRLKQRGYTIVSKKPDKGDRRYYCTKAPDLSGSAKSPDMKTPTKPSKPTKR